MPDLEQLSTDDIAWLENFLNPNPHQPTAPADHSEQIEAAVDVLREELPGDWSEAALWGLLLSLWRIEYDDNTGVDVALAAQVEHWLEQRCSEGDPATDQLKSDGFRYYKVTASHDRLLSHSPPSFRWKFTAPIQAVRVPLPPKPNSTTIETKIGSVRADDHLAFSREEIVDGYQREFRPQTPVDVDRVDLITGGRRGSHRFCPVSVYIAYAKDRARFFVLQSANFFGQKARLYFSENMVGHPIVTRSAFRPTPFAATHNTYRFWMQESVWPDKAPESFCLRGQLYYSGDPRRADDPNGQSLAMYMDMNMNYQVLDKPDTPTRPSVAQASAFARVCAIEDWKGREHHQRGRLGEIMHTLAASVGKQLEWDVRGQPSST